MNDADRLELGTWNAICWECGRKGKAGGFIKHWKGYYVCPRCWEPRHPQDFVRAIPDIVTPPWIQPRGAASYGQARVDAAASGGAAGGGIATTTTVIIDLPWAPGGGTLGTVTLTDYATPPATAVNVLVNIPEGLTITGAISVGSGWATGTTFIINNHGTVLTTPSWPANTNITVNGIQYGDVVVNPDYTLEWNFEISGPVMQLRFTVQPSDVAPATNISPAIEVSLIGIFGIALANFTGPITLEIGYNAGDPTNGILSGTLTKDAVAGVATFSDIQLDQPGNGYTLIASTPDIT